MNPWFDDGTVKIYNDDCRDVLRSLPDDSYDLVLTDFPYGNTTEYDGYEDTKENLGNLIADTMPEILRVGKRALIACGVANIQMFPQADWILAWVTPAGAGSGPWGFCCWQPILAYGKDPYLQAGMGRRPDYISSGETAGERKGKKATKISIPAKDKEWSKGVNNRVYIKEPLHPCPKPIGFWTWLLERGSVSNEDLVLDPFMGMGTTLVAARNTGRKAVGIDLSKKYCEAAKEWYLRQPPLFTTS